MRLLFLQARCRSEGLTTEIPVMLEPRGDKLRVAWNRNRSGDAAMPRHGSDPIGIDLDAYFVRIGYEGPRTPTRDTLHALHALHPAAIAFENLDPLLSARSGSTPPRLNESLCTRGVAAIASSTIFCSATRCGHWDFVFAILPPASSGTRPPARSCQRVHMLLQVEAGGAPYVADVGFGGLTLTAPLRLEPDKEQPTPHEPFRLLATGENFELQARLRDGWKAIYEFDLQEQSADYEVANWYHCTNTDSHFNATLVAARPGGSALCLAQRRVIDP